VVADVGNSLSSPASRKRQAAIPLVEWQADDLALGITVPRRRYRFDDAGGRLVCGHPHEFFSRMEGGR
jgi:hypothetical protein